MAHMYIHNFLSHLKAHNIQFCKTTAIGSKHVDIKKDFSRFTLIHDYLRFPSRETLRSRTILLFLPYDKCFCYYQCLRKRIDYIDVVINKIS